MGAGTAGAGGTCIHSVHDEYLYPNDLFEQKSGSQANFWTCVRSRPRFEKKLATFLKSRNIAHYLPVVQKNTCSGRKARTTAIPLIPGFLFAKGDFGKRAFADSGCVAYVLKPSNCVEQRTLDRQIRVVREVLLRKRFVELSTDYRVGEEVTILSGPLSGISGRIVSLDKSKRLVVGVDMLGVGVSVVLSPDTRVARVDASRHQPEVSAAK